MSNSLLKSAPGPSLRSATFSGRRAWFFGLVCLIVSSCTASAPLKPPSLSNILTPDTQTGGQPEQQPVDQQPAQLAAQQNTTASTQEKIAGSHDTPVVSNRPPGVPKVRPTTTTLAPAIEHALVPVKKPVTPSQAVAEKLAKGSATVKTTPSTFGGPDEKPGSTAPAVGQAAAIESPEKPKKKTSIFANLFQSTASQQSKNETLRTGVKRTSSAQRPSRSKRLNWASSSLPGVRGREIFGFGIQENHELDDSIQLASVTNRARRGSHGLLLQREDVKVGCFPPELVRLLKQVERRFGRTPVVTSGYRSANHNKKIRGARNSMHIHCKAADIQVKGVSKTRLAKYLRSLPGRGGVGTYCNTRSVHIDVGKKRDWNRRCRRRRVRKT